MSAVVADTHTTIWFLTRAPELSVIAHTALTDAEQLGYPIVAATALALGIPLITRDRKIRALTNITTIW